MYINSTGSQRSDGQAVAFETDAMAILDTMNYIRPEVHTLCVGQVRTNEARKRIYDGNMLWGTSAGRFAINSLSFSFRSDFSRGPYNKYTIQKDDIFYINKHKNILKME